MTKRTALLAGVALVASLLLPVCLSAQPSTCPTLGADQKIPENQRILAAERDGVSTLDFSAKYAGSSVTLEGVLCDPQGNPLGNTEIELTNYSMKPDAKPTSPDGRPSVEDLKYANGNPYSVHGTRTVTTSADGHFRFIGVPPGKVALSVDWARVTGLPFVTWAVSWESGPVMVVGRAF